MKLNPQMIQSLLQLINDPSSYEWGEYGTFELGMQLRFYNDAQKLVGILEFDKTELRQTKAIPYLKRTKWGVLSIKASERMQQIIK